MESLEWNKYDSSVSYLYKQSLRLNVPVRFVLVKPTVGPAGFFLEIFDLSDHPEAEFTTIFSYIRTLVLENPIITLTELWNVIKEFQGDLFNPPELTFIWLHAIPEYRIDNIAVYQQIVNFLNSINETVVYDSMKSVLNYYNHNWLLAYEKELSEDKKTVEKFIKIQGQISDIQPVIHSDITLDSAIVSYDYSFDQNPLPDIFNSATTSYIIPYIQYNDSSKTYFKIYQGRSLDTQPNYANTTINPKSHKSLNTIYLNVWTDSDNTKGRLFTEEDARKGRKEGFLISTIAYLPNQKILRVTVHSQVSESVNQNTIIQRLHKNIPFLPIPESKIIKENKISGHFNIYNVLIYDEVLLDLITNNSLFDSYLYIDESQESFASKKRLNIHYRGAIIDRATATEGRNKAAVSVTINQKIIPKGEIIQVKTENGSANYKVPDQTPVVNVNMTKASSRFVADQFINILTRLITVYQNKASDIANRYIEFIPDYREIFRNRYNKLYGITYIEPTIQNGVILHRDENKLEILRKYVPGVFIEEYPRKMCQGKNQPTPINQHEIQMWASKQFEKNQVREYYQVLPFPFNDPKYYFVCTNPQFPYPGLKINTLANKDTYPCLPCCYGTNQFERLGSDLNKCINGEVVQKQVTVKETKRIGHILSTDKVLDPGRAGFVENVISNFLQKYAGEGRILRYGVPLDPSSFIHAVLLGAQFPDYLSSQDRIAYVNYVRQNLFKTGLLPEIFKQELYDLSLEEITRKATDLNEFFDPLLFYRGMEELTNSNIYIIGLSSRDRFTGSETSLLKIPRYKYFHVHPPVPGRKVIIVVRHWGSESNNLTMPQCELLVVQMPDNNIIYHFDQIVNEVMYPSLIFVGRTITWQIDNKSLITRQDLYSKINYKLLFGTIPIESQIIDSAGKARVFTLIPEKNSDLRIYVNVPPTAPLNIPEIKPKDIKNKLPPYQKCIELFGEPNSSTTNTDQTMITGIWFRVGDVTYGFYCPCKEVPVSEIPNLPKDPELATLTIPIPREEYKISNIDRIRIFRRTSKFITQIIQYLYLVANRPKNISEFLDSIITMYVGEKDSAYLYESKGIQRILPSGSVSEILNALSKQNSTIFPDGKILVYNDRMKIGLKYILDQWAKDIEKLKIDLNSLRSLHDYYISGREFESNPEEVVLDSIDEFNYWSSINVPSSSLQQRKIQNLKENVQTHLRSNAYTYQEPYIFQKSGSGTIGTSLDTRQDKFYLIQNVTGGELRRAIQVAYTWYTEKINTGFSTQKYENDVFPVYIIYRISQGLSIMIENNQSRGHERYLEILNYGNNFYAAMLPLL